MFGSKRLIFASDYPFTSYETYFGILEQMDFTKEEIDDIAYNNIVKLCKL